MKITSGAIAAGAAGPHVWTGGAARAETPNERLGVAAIGVGPRGTRISRQAGNLGNMVAVCD